MRCFIIFTLTLLLAVQCFNIASAMERVLSDSTQEERAKTIFSKVKCLVCKGESIKDSNSHLALLMRESIRQQVLEEHSNEEIIEAVKMKYGEEAIFISSVDKSNLLLYILPVILFAFGIYKTVSRTFK